VRWWPGLALIVASACSSEVAVSSDAKNAAIDAPAGSDPDDGARSGTRLKLTWFDFSDGTRQWDGFYDAQRKEPCYIFQNWTDGKAYCVPDYSGSIVYTNATCTSKVAEVYKGSSCQQPVQPYALEYVHTPCESKPDRLWVLGAKQPLASYYYKTTDGACMGPYTTSTSYDYYALGGEVARSELVNVTLGAPTGQARLGVRFYESPDGMRLQAIVHDALLGTDCYPQTHAIGATTGSCAPSAHYIGYSQDAACSQHKLAISKQCAVPKYAVYYPPNGCPADAPQYYALGALTAGSPLYYHNGTSCVATTPSTASDYYRVGAQLAVAPVDRTVSDSQARLRHIRYTNADGLRYRNYYLYDTQMQADCYPTKLPDGTIRCVVNGGYTRELYTNSTCTTTIDLVEVQSGSAGCGAPTLPKFARKFVTPQPGTCTYGTQVFTVGAPYTGIAYENFGTCQVYTPVNAALYRVGPQVPLNEFVSATKSIDQ
jgi:hypothetical protein